jgi:hypothetical protein
MQHPWRVSVEIVMVLQPESLDLDFISTRRPAVWNFRMTRRDQSNDRRRGARSRQRYVLGLEALEHRKLLDASGPSLLASPPASSNPGEVQSASMAIESQDLIKLYQAYQQNPSNVSGLAAQYPQLRIQGATVAIAVKGRGDYGALSSSLNDLGMQVTASSATYAEVDGYLPIAQLPAVAALPQTLSASPIYKPISGPPRLLPPSLPPAPPPIPLPPLPLPPLRLPRPPVPPLPTPPQVPPIVPGPIVFSGSANPVQYTSEPAPTGTVAATASQEQTPVAPGRVSTRKDSGSHAGASVILGHAPFAKRVRHRPIVVHRPQGEHSPAALTSVGVRRASISPLFGLLYVKRNTS